MTHPIDQYLYVGSSKPWHADVRLEYDTIVAKLNEHERALLHSLFETLCEEAVDDARLNTDPDGVDRLIIIR